MPPSTGRESTPQGGLPLGLYRCAVGWASGIGCPPPPASLRLVARLLTPPPGGSDSLTSFTHWTGNMGYILPRNRAWWLGITPPLRGSRQDQGGARSRTGGGQTPPPVSDYQMRANPQSTIHQSVSSCEFVSIRGSSCLYMDIFFPWLVGLSHGLAFYPARTFSRNPCSSWGRGEVNSSGVRCRGW